MNIKTRLSIMNNHYYDYLKDNSNWIKELSRSSSNMINFIDFIKDKYSLKLSDRIDNIINKIDMINGVLSALK